MSFIEAMCPLLRGRDLEGGTRPLLRGVSFITGACPCGSGHVLE